MTDQQQPKTPRATVRPASYQNTADGFYPLPFFITRGEPYTADPGDQTQPTQAAPEHEPNTDS
jgi:hypothetical protein